MERSPGGTTGILWIPGPAHKVQSRVGHHVGGVSEGGESQGHGASLVLQPGSWGQGRCGGAPEGRPHLDPRHSHSHPGHSRLCSGFPQATDSRTVPPCSTLLYSSPSPPLPAHHLRPLQHCWGSLQPGGTSHRLQKAPPLAGGPQGGAHSPPSLLLPGWAPAPGAPVPQLLSLRGSDWGHHLSSLKASPFPGLPLRAMSLLSITPSGTLNSGLQAPQGTPPLPLRPCSSEAQGAPCRPPSPP